MTDVQGTHGSVYQTKSGKYFLVSFFPQIFFPPTQLSLTLEGPVIIGRASKKETTRLEVIKWLNGRDSKP